MDRYLLFPIEGLFINDICMDVTITSKIGADEVTVIRDGSIIIAYGSDIWVEVAALRYRFKFENIKEGENLIDVTPPSDPENGHMEILIRVNESNLDSVFLPPSFIGTFTEDNDSQSHSLGLSFAAKKLSGASSNCIQFTYTFFLS